MTADQLSVFSAQSPSQGRTEGWGWMGGIADFLALPVQTWLQQMGQRHQQLYGQRPTATHQQAWQDTAAVLRQALQGLQPPWTLIFEYELPREGGRRPDVILLAGAQVWVLEFKQKVAIATADLDQAAAYGRDLQLYHPGCRQLQVHSRLVVTRRESLPDDPRPVLTPAALQALFQQLPEAPPAVEPTAWVHADYAPLPTIIQAARQIFQRQPLPNIRRADSAGIPELMQYLYALVEQAAAQQQRHLVLITGVPGAGKTLVGLQLVHQHPLATDASSNAVFLSGNGPLVQVLQYALKSRVFVQPVRNFYLQHEVRRQSAPAEHLIVFDEAQRAWDQERMGEKYGVDSPASGAVLSIAERIPDWSVVVALIGEGQTIHVGEEDGIDQWQGSVRRQQQPWHVHCPPHYASVFEPVAAALTAHERFNLTTSLRTHRAGRLQSWVNALLAGELDAAGQQAEALTQEGFDLYLTRDLDAAKAYCRQRYGDQPSKRYGMVASSRGRNLPDYGIANDYRSTLRVKTGPWYIDPPESSLSCCALEQVVTEFGCQGLELDFALVAWGSDLVWNDSWQCTTRQRRVKDPQQLRLNSYRVLLTRGRDGMVVFVPPDPALEATAAALQVAGLPALQ